MILHVHAHTAQRLTMTFNFHYQLMHLLLKTLSQFTFKNIHVKNVCDAYLKLNYKIQHVSVSPPTIIRGHSLCLAQLLRVSMPASSHSSLWRYVVCTCILAMYLSVWCLDVYTSRHHTDRYIASIHVQTTYRHRLECDEADMLTRSNCAKHVD